MSLLHSMTELEKDIGNLRSGLKGVDSVSPGGGRRAVGGGALTFLVTHRSWSTRRTGRRSRATSLCRL